jgi:hypothetical protein
MLDLIEEKNIILKKYIYEMSGSISTYLIKEMNDDSVKIIRNMKDTRKKNCSKRKATCCY